MISLIDSAPGVEMTGDARFAARVRRLTVVSAIALGCIWGLQVATLDAGWGVDLAMFAGWLLMPTVLGVSLASPGLRRAVMLPATLVTLALLAVCATALPDEGLQRSGWLLITAGILLGGGLGLWFWYRWVPVPSSLDDPYSLGRWAAIVVHVGLIVVGLALVVIGASLA